MRDLKMKRTKKSREIHKSVLIEEVVEALNFKDLAHLKKQIRIIDATVGTGGHSIKFIERKAFVLGIDRDMKMLGIANEGLTYACSVLNRPVQDSFLLVHGNFKNIDEIAKKYNFTNVDGILFDLGISTLHFKSFKKGFSFADPSAILDMRLDPDNQEVKASDLLNALDERNLRTLFAKVMDEGVARKLAKKVCEYRKKKPFAKVKDLLELTQKLRWKKGVHKATLPFLALRIATNSELENLKEALPKALSLLSYGGRLLVISFHSGEDRIVKNFYKESGQKILTKKPIIPDEIEIKENPSARSAKLRILERIN